MMNRSQADTIAVLVAALRPGWDVRGIMTALGELRDRDPYDVAQAALNAAAIPTNRTPAVIALPGPHWAHTVVAAVPPPYVPRRGPRADPGLVTELAGQARTAIRAAREATG